MLLPPCGKWWPLIVGDPQLLGTTLEVHKATPGMVVKEICEAVITLMRPRGKETGEFPLNNCRICKEDVWMLCRNNWWCLCYTHGEQRADASRGWSTTAAEAPKDNFGIFLDTCNDQVSLASWDSLMCSFTCLSCWDSPFFLLGLFLHCALQLLYSTQKKARED